MAGDLARDIDPGSGGAQSISQRTVSGRSGSWADSDVIVRCSENCRAIEHLARAGLRAFAQGQQFWRMKLQYWRAMQRA
jgi:hypothetical protein